MPGKKKKSGGKKKGSKKKEYLPMVYDFPKFEDPDLVTPKVDLLIKLSEPKFDIFNLKIKLPITTRIQYVIKKIQEKHQNAIGDVLLSKNFNTNEFLDPDKTLEDYNIFGDSEYVLFYEYKPVIKPILGPTFTKQQTSEN